MYKNIISFLIIILIFSLNGCQDKKKSTATVESKTTIKFVLNDGKKWQMDEHTRNAIKNLNSLLNSEEAFESIVGYNQLGQKLDDELILLIQGCTMEGPDHDQLHIFLGYFYPQVQSLKKEADLALAENQVHEMKSLFEEYHKYFE